ncbi:biotin-dependent carboxyltransferase family protein [Actinoplanes oblitus]|uniref:Biotin-dependent carboxyltransferase family protein n=1 Tax=Actinoplanes oblitus TaxID=3040509 RepID=A0ABY8W6E4_9ACTN|nr:biotin-dependent carboxyltransferase family protein [Actinoplanes oblitus]WIM93082.1 biotin-dependent carboxyltransferase family protein [Actinoplanes oblitus]
MIEVLAPGPLATIQDLGRPGFAAVGVGRSGAADRAALTLANRLVANPEGAACVETLLGGLTVRALRQVWVAIAGAPAPATVDGTPAGHHALFTLRPGQRLRLGTPPTGLRTYLAVRGGVDVPPVLGSRSRDTLSGIGPEPLAVGTLLPIGPEPPAWPVTEVAPVPVPPGGPVTLRAIRGPRDHFLTDPLALRRDGWTVSSRSDRIGLRLTGNVIPVDPAAAGIPSEGLARGAVQLPPGGEPVVFLADHPTTGGYPVVAVLLDADVDRASQLRPGQPVRIALTD